jgi:hypothetical protein
MFALTFLGIGKRFLDRHVKAADQACLRIAATERGASCCGRRWLRRVLLLLLTQGHFDRWSIFGVAAAFDPTAGWPKPSCREGLRVMHGRALRSLEVSDGVYWHAPGWHSGRDKSSGRQWREVVLTMATIIPHSPRDRRAAGG